MRDVKFRGKRMDNGEWVYGFLYRHDPPLQCFSGEGKELPSFVILKTGFADWNMPRPIDQCEVDGETVGQFTGLHDRQGKEIYESDIVEFWGGIGEIIYFEPYASFRIQMGENDLFDTCECAVIGNICENPELIKSNTHEKNK